MSLLSYPIKCLLTFFFSKTHVIDYSSCVIDYITPKKLQRICSNRLPSITASKTLPPARLQHAVIDYSIR